MAAASRPSARGRIRRRKADLQPLPGLRSAEELGMTDAVFPFGDAVLLAPAEILACGEQFRMAFHALRFRDAMLLAPILLYRCAIADECRELRQLPTAQN